MTEYCKLNWDLRLPMSLALFFAEKCYEKWGFVQTLTLEYREVGTVGPADPMNQRPGCTATNGAGSSMTFVYAPRTIADPFDAEAFKWYIEEPRGVK
jgi:hypothetical protein